jgi:hypothetical protein
MVGLKLIYGMDANKKGNTAMEKKFTFLILEQNGNIDTEEKTLPIDEGFAQAGRFLNLFKDDPFKRVARVMIGFAVLATFDGETNLLTVGRPDARFDK